MPAPQWHVFADLLSIVTHGEATCVGWRRGYCTMPNTCSAYSQYNLWDYDFKVGFTTTDDDSYIRVPLSTFAEDDAETKTCNIYIQYLPFWNRQNNDDTETIVLGTMFF